MKAEGGRVRQDLRTRTKQSALRVIRLYKALPRRDGVAEVLGKQLLRSATSVAAHYREGCRAKSNATLPASWKARSRNWRKARFGSNCWLRGPYCQPNECNPLQDETNELISMFVTMTKSVKRQTRI
jgi:four helix bundle protein